MASEETVEKPGQSWKMKLEFADTPRSGQDVLRISSLSVGYGDRVLLEDVNLHLGYGERAVLIGPNGIGKTTLLRCITGQLRPWAGEVRLGRGVRVGYMAQEQETLDRTVTPLALIRGLCRWMKPRRELSPLLPVRRRRSFRAGGPAELGRAQPAGVGAAGRAGLQPLLLDEPINHLDIPSRESFERAMARFEGTVSRSSTIATSSNGWRRPSGRRKIGRSRGEGGRMKAKG